MTTRTRPKTRSAALSSAPLLGVHCSIAGGVSRAPLMGAELGCRAIQFFTGSNQRWESPSISTGEARAFATNMVAGKIAVAFAHAGYLINLASPDDGNFRRSIGAMQEELMRAAALHLPFVVLHPGAPKEKGAEWGIRRVAAALDELLAVPHTHPVKIALETTAGQGSTLGSTFGELAAIIGATRGKARLGVCIDTAHLFAAGYDISTPAGYDKTLRVLERCIGLSRLLAIHLNDSLGALGSRRDRHTHIGKGKIGLAAFRRIMTDSRLASVPKVLETPKEGDWDSRNLRVLRGFVGGKD